MVAHREREVELYDWEESDDLPMVIMASASDKTRNLLSNGIDTKKTSKAHIAELRTTSVKTAQNWQRDANWTPKTAKTPTSHISRIPKL